MFRIKTKPKKSPRIPATRPGALEPEWLDGLLRLPANPAKSTLRGKALAAALAALRGLMLELAEDATKETNVDPRLPGYIRDIAGRMPDKAPPQAELFRIAHDLEVLRGSAGEVNDEWPGLLAQRYHAATLAYDRTVRQFPRWRAFLANAQDRPKVAVDKAALAAAVVETKIVFGDELALEFIAREIPENLEKLAEPLTGQADWRGEIARGGDLLAEDVLESTNNILKRVAELGVAAKGKIDGSFAGAGLKKFQKEFGKSFEKEMGEQGAKFGKRVVKWGLRILTASGPAYLIATFPDKFGWMVEVVKFLSHVSG